jgi:hypothetical protein
MFGRRQWWYAAVAGVLAALPCTAYAAAWAWPISGPVSLAFGSQWTDPAGRTCTHGGVDISSSSGEHVLACAGGRVTFAGRVPAAGGGSTLAVSVVTVDGLKYTCLPLSDLAVSQGQDVERETVLGSLARSGDGSSDATHLHLTVRRGDLALDPVSLLEERPAPVAAPETRPPGVESPRAGESVPGPAPDHSFGPARAAGARGSSPAPVTSAPGRSAINTPVTTGPTASAFAGHPYPAARAALSRRIRPLPARVALDLGATYAAMRAWTQDTQSVAMRLLLAALGGLLVAPVLRSVAGSARPSGAALAPASARRTRR